MTTVAPVMENDDVPITRLLDLRELLARKSHFLLGPRQTGKTFLIRQVLRTVRRYDLLDHAVFLDLSRDPGRLGQEIPRDERLVVIDEVQRLPSLLNEVHRLIEERRIRFLLTGSSARRLSHRDRDQGQRHGRPG
jgi:predicted AAA+ superfamily ATPase